MDNHIDNLPTPVAGQESMIGPFRFIAGLFSLMLRTASEATRIAGEIHGVINERPAPLARSQGAEPVPTPRIYQLIHLAFIHIANQLHKLIEFVPKPGFVSPEVAQLQSVMNGVFGDKLHDWGHPSAIEMQVLNRHNQATSLDQLQQQYPQLDSSLNTLSIGMSGDLEAAIAAGSTAPGGPPALCPATLHQCLLWLGQPALAYEPLPVR